MVHKFYESLVDADDPVYAPFWESAYRAYFRNFSSRTPAPGKSEGQKRGVDVLVYCHHDQIHRIDEKLRKSDYRDLLLEFISNDNRKTPGWIEKDLAIDYLAYGILPARKAFLFPFPALQRAWQLNGAIWKEKYTPWVEAENEGYTTLSVAVPFGVIFAALSQASIVIDLPVPEKAYAP